MDRTRRQLSLFVPAPVAAGIEAVRAIVDPVQRALIPAHVTLCREDELAGIEERELERRMASAPHVPLTLSFGRAKRFAGHGVLLPCVAGEERFRALREWLLDSNEVREQQPHLTMAHPRNPETPGDPLATAHGLPELLVVTFSEACLIEQHGDAPWRVLWTVVFGR